MSPILSTFAAGSVRGFTSAGGGGRFELINGVYVWNGDSITGLSDFDDNALASLPNNSQCFIRYPLKVRSGTQTITASAIRNSAVLSQSIFAYPVSSGLQYTDSVQTVVSNSNDDNDNLVMDGNGFGVVAYNQNPTTPTAGNWSNIQGAALQSNDISDPWLIAPFPNNVQQHLAAFPGTGFAAWLKFSSDSYKVGSGRGSDTFATKAAGSQFGTILNSYSGDMKNNVYSISDGINGILIGRWGQNIAQYIEFNLTDGSIYHSSQINYSSNPTQLEDSEEDFEGDQFLAINGAASFYAAGTFYYGGNVGFRSHPGQFALSGSGRTNMTAGIDADQSGMDICTTVDSSRYLYFGDWGHDNAGLFNNGGNDDRLNVRRTNVRQLTATSTPSSL